MISKIMDLTADLAVGNKVVIDISGWESLTVQAIGGGGTMSLSATNNGGDVTGSLDGSPGNAANFTAIQAVNLTDGTTATTVTGNNLFRITPISFKYLQIGDGATATATKLLVFVTKPY